MPSRRHPRPVDWDEYSARLLEELRTLLESSPTEALVQSFLELHPALIPYPQGFAGGGGIRGAQGSLHFAVFTQPPLPGIERPVPDFMRIARDSGGFYPLLIEIEAPKKRVINNDGSPSAQFAQAVGQMATWQHWFAQPAHQVEFRELYQIPGRWAHRPIHPRFILVYGRRAELEDARAMAAREGFSKPEVTIMSFDRLQPSSLGAMDVTVRVVGRRFEAVAFSPTFKVGPQLAEDLALLEGKSNALERSAMAPERKRFLQQRILHWEKVAGQDAGITAGIWE